MKKTILITGASTGIGKETARYFAEKGWQVAATMRKPDSVTDLAETARLKKLRLDVQDTHSIEQAVRATLETFGQIDVLLNNAGYAVYGPLEEATEDQIRRQFDVNVIGLIQVTQAVLPHMRQRKSGTIINVSSVGGRITTPYGALYHGTKWSVEGLTETLKYELEPLGITLRLVEPGAVKTDFGTRSMTLTHGEIEDYQTSFGKMKEIMGDNNRWPSMPLDIAKVIFKAANDPGKKLRYVAGSDAKTFLRLRSLLGSVGTQSIIKRYLKL